MSSFVPSACLHVKQQSQALGQGVRIEDSASTNAYEGYFSTSNNFLFVFANTPRTAWAINYNGGMQVNVADPGHFGFTVKQLADTLGYGLKLLSNANHYFQWTVTGTASMQMDYDGSAKWYIDGSNGALGIGVNPGNANILDIVQTVNNNGGGIRLRETPVGTGFYTDLYKQATTHKFLIQNNAGGDYIAIGNDTTVNNAVLYVNGPLYTAGNIYMSGTLVATSDKTRKKNIKNLAGALSKVTALQGVSFNWKSKEQSPDRQVGLIAQDVEPVLPELVVKANDLEGDHLALNYMGMIPYLVEAVKELAAEVKSLKAKLGES